MSSAPTADPRAQPPADDVATEPTRTPDVAGASRSQLPPGVLELGLAFRHVFRTLSRLRGRDTHLGGSELSHAQFELLIELDERGELSAGELAVAARISPATVTQMLDGLADSGYVERTRSDSDRRVVMARLTAEGQVRVDAKRAAWQERWKHALDGVSPREMRSAAKVLERLGEMFEQGPPAEAAESSAEATEKAATTGRKPA
jgi:MarR family transcriptional regulator, organic hydroperoxide resistance regulator